MPPFTPRRTRRGGGGGSGRGARAQGGPPKGLFETINSKWYCDCTPRIQAAIRTVQKDGKNKGRKFWTCAQDRRDQCGFFLWDEDARARELEAQEAAGQPPPSTQRFRQTRLTDDDGGGGGGGGGAHGFTQTAPPETPTRPRVVKAAPIVNEDDDSSSSSSSSDTDVRIARDDAPGSSAAAATAATRSQRSSVTATNAPSQSSSSALTLGRPSPSQQQKTKKRKHDDYSDEDFEGSDVERSLAELTDSVVASTSSRQRKGMPAAAPTTPSKSNNLPPGQRDAGLPPTPVSRNTLLIAREGGGNSGNSSHKRVRLSTPTGGISSPTSSPTPRASTSSNSAQAVDAEEEEEEEDEEDYAVTREVLAILSAHMQQHHNQQKAVVPDPALLRSAVRGCLDAWALRAEGVRMGRDLVREGVASRDARIAELQDRVAALERERAVDRRRIAEYREAAKKLLED